MFKNRVLFAGLFFLALNFVYFYGGKIPYMLIYVMISLPVISLLYTWIISARFRYIQQTDRTSALKGERVNYILSVKNRDFSMYPYINIKLSGVENFYSRELKTISHSLEPYQEKSFSFDLECKYRGQYEIGLKAIEIEDFLGIFKFKRKTEKTISITVFPKIVSLERFGSMHGYLPEVYSNTRGKVYEDISTISDIRKYEYGDNYKKIHWKLSAKMNNLMVRNYQTTSKTKVVVFLDLRKNSFSGEQNIIIEDKLIEAAVSVINYLLINRINLDVVYHTSELIRLEADNPGNFDGIYGILAGVPFASNIDLKKLVGIYLNDNMVNTKYIIITSNLDDALFSEIPESKLFGHETQLIYISHYEMDKTDESFAEKTMSALSGTGMVTYKVNLSDNIKEILER